jgi:hypothetical protein
MEIQLAHNIMDLLDELKIISVVIADQKGVVKDLERVVKGKKYEENVGIIKKVEDTVDKLNSTALNEYKQVRSSFLCPGYLSSNSSPAQRSSGSQTTTSHYTTRRYSVGFHHRDCYICPSPLSF